MEPQNYEYVRLYTLVTTIAIGIVLTLAAVVYAISSATAFSDAKSILDQVVQRNDMTLCATAPEAEQKSCYHTAFPVVAQAATCARIPFIDMQAQCRDYFARLETLTQKAVKLRKNFTYEQVLLEVTFKDGSTKPFRVLTADTDEKRIQGLSYVPSMQPEEGMLFSFPPGIQNMAFHMKDMLIPLDIIYLTKDLTPVQSFRNLPSCAGFEGECPLQVRQGSDVQYVLEILPQGKDVLGVKLLRQ